MHQLRIFLPALLVLSVLIPQEGWAQRLSYDVFLKKDKVGEMKVDRYQKEGRDIYRSEMEITVKFVFTVNLRFTYESHFKDGKLIYALVRNYRNGDLEDQTHCWIDDDGKLQVKHGDERLTVEEPVTYSVLNSYYEAPGSHDQMFSERWGRFQPFVAVEDGRYALYIANGNKSYYTFKEGQCERISLKHTLATLNIVRRRE